MNKEDKFIVTDVTDTICIGGFGNDLGNIGLLKYNEQEIANMIIENNTKNDDIRLVNSLLNTIRKQKEVIDKAKDKLYCWGEVLDADFQKQMLDILKEVE